MKTKLNKVLMFVIAATMFGKNVFQFSLSTIIRQTKAPIKRSQHLSGNNLSTFVERDVERDVETMPGQTVSTFQEQKKCCEYVETKFLKCV